MARAHQPEMASHMEKRVMCLLNGGRKVIGVLRGFDHFMNVVLENSHQDLGAGNKHELGMTVIRGNSIIMVEPLERV